MTTQVLRRTSTLLLAVCAAVLAVAMLAGPATATEGSDAGSSDEAAHEPAGFGSGLWDGMILAGAGGLLLGILVFGMSKPGEIDRDGH